MSAFFRLQMEHIVARQHEGGSVEGNLALGCQHCNLRKGTNLTGIDPETGNITRLFNPRLDIWNEHFRVAGPLLLGQTAIGRTTVRLLDMNSDSQRDLRKLNPLE
jgi:hypothetical protein